MTSRTGSARRILGILKKSRVESCLGRRRLTFACSWRPCDGYARVGVGVGGRWKSQNRKNVYLSPYVGEPLNSKVIKGFVPELRSRKCFCLSGFLCSMLYMLRTFYVRFTHSRIWLWYTWERYESNYSSPSNGQIAGQTRFFHLGMAICLCEGKLCIQNSCTPLKNWPGVASCSRRSGRV